MASISARLRGVVGRWPEEAGQGLAEYGLIVALVAIVAIPALMAFFRNGAVPFRLLMGAF